MLVAAARPQSSPKSQPNSRPKSPCVSAAVYRQLDFWVGQWTVGDNGRDVATSEISKAEDGCVILERYVQGDGFSGRSMSFYDAVLGKWRQTWVDAFGNVSIFTGEIRDGVMHFEGASNRSDGSKVLRRMTLTKQTDGRVRHYSERSVDGVTWELAYDYLYRAKPRADENTNRQD